MLRPLIIDCDTGRDDALAIWLALALQLPLTGIVSSYGNATPGHIAENCMRVLAFAGRADIPLYVGAIEPSRSHKCVDAVLTPRQAAAGNGLCNLELPEAESPPAPLAPEGLAAAIRALADKHGKIDYVITGPATNFASICHSVRDCVARVTMMGGKMDALWAAMPNADFNIACDPFAVDTILKSGIDMRFVSMNTTWPIVLTLAEVEALKPRTDIAVFARDLMIAHCKYFAPEPVFRFHDPSVILTLADDSAFEKDGFSVVTDETRDDFGRLMRGPGGSPASIHVSGDAMRKDMLDTMLKALGF